MALGVTRSYGDARLWAADASGLIGVSFREWFWAGWLPHDYGEGSLFPGLTIATLAVLAVAYGPRVLNRVRGGADLYVRRYRPWSRGLLAVGAVLALMAFARWDAYRPYRIFTVAALALVAALFTSARFRASWTQRDPVMFYAVAAVCFWLLALGPEPAWRGQRLLTYGPYRLFFALHAPVVVRVSARAWAGVLPCLAMLAAFGIRVLIDRLPRGRNAIVTAAAVMIAAECWFVEGTKAVPPRMAAGLIPAGATVLDVPIDDAFANAAAQYRAVRGDYRTINGYSGYDSPEFVRLILAFRDRRYDLVDRYRRHDLYVIVRPGADASFTGWLQSNGAVRQSEAADAVVYRLPGRGGG